MLPEPNPVQPAASGTHNTVAGRAAAIIQARDIHGDVHVHPPVQPQPVEGQVVVGLIPCEPPNFQLPDQVATLTGMSGTICIICAVTGQRGVGKTQLAAAYARQRARDGWLVAWIPAQSADLITAGMADLADRLGIRNPEDDAHTAAARLREHLQTRPEPALLIFDNLNDLDAVADYLPAAGQTQVVITTTNRAAESMGRPVPLDVFDTTTAVRFLRQATNLNDDTGAHTLATELGFLPLALAQAAARIRSAGWDYPTYLERFRHHPANRHLTTAAGQPYPLGAPAAILLALEPFYTNEPSPTSQLLETLAVLSPDGVSRTILTANTDPTTLDDDLARLHDASLIEFSGDGTRAITMHRLVQRIIRDRCQQTGTYTQTLARQTTHLATQTIDEDDAWRLRPEGDELVRQIDALWDNTSFHRESMDLGPLLTLRIWAVRHLTATAALVRAIPLAHAVATDTTTHLGADHPDTLTSVNNLAYAYRSVGRLAEAIPLYEQNLTDRRRVLGADHPDTLTSANNLAIAYRSVGRLAEAIPLYEQNLTDRRRVLGADHPDTLASVNNLAYAYRSVGRLAEAIPLFEQNLTDRRRVLGADHPSTLASAGNLASAYRAVGRLAEAIPLFEQTLADACRVLDEDHPMLAVIRSNLESVKSE